MTHCILAFCASAARSSPTASPIDLLLSSDIKRSDAASASQAGSSSFDSSTWTHDAGLLRVERHGRTQTSGYKPNRREAPTNNCSVQYALTQRRHIVLASAQAHSKLQKLMQASNICNEAGKEVHGRSGRTRLNCGGVLGANPQLVCDSLQAQQLTPPPSPLRLPLRLSVEFLYGYH